MIHIEEEILEGKPLNFMDSILKGIVPELKVSKPKRGGLNEITDLREQTAQLIGKTIQQVYGLTRGWSKDEIYRTLHSAQQFTKNPGACWWVIYKKNKDTYGKITKKGLSGLGKAGRAKDSAPRQETLF